jgi:chaperonin GroEL
METHILRNDKVRESFIKGIDTVADVVGSTMGASGNTVMISQGFCTVPIATKDGITVAASIMMEDEYANVAAMCLRNAGDKTVVAAGDGTTQTIVLARSIIKEGLKHVTAGAQSQSLKRGIDKAVSAVVSKVQEMSIPIGSQDAKLFNIATVSANNDVEVGGLIAEAYKKIGDNGLLRIELSQTVETHVKIVDGFEFSRGYQHQGYVNVPEKMQTVYDNPLIFVSNYILSNIKDIQAIMGQMVDTARPVIIIARGIEGEVMSTLLANKIKGGLKICSIKAPNTYTDECLADIATLTGATVISDEAGIKLTSSSMEHLGTCEKIIVSYDKTVIINGAGSKDGVKDRCSEIQVLINEATEKAVKDVHTKRLAQLTGSIGVIYVGGSSDLEAREKLDRMDDAVRACKSAIEEGISTGGGVTLLRCIESLDSVECSNEDEKAGVNIVKKAMEVPLRQMLKNAGLDESYIVSKVKEGKGGYGFNIKTMEYCDLSETGVVDPTKVIRVALQNAASVAGQMITSNSLIVNMKEK